jgi:U3 small nucleolar RNA-associated protein 14
MKGVDGLDEHGRAALQERADRAEDLRRKVLGKDDVANSDASDEDHFDVDDADDDAIRANAFDELTALERREADEAAQGKPGGLAGMKFMVRAAAVEKQRADELAADLRRDLEGRPDEDDEDVADDAAPASNRVEGNVGRLAFAPSLVRYAARF